jgi:EmrB/QacA subfamily drug resistance transporter
MAMDATTEIYQRRWWALGVLGLVLIAIAMDGLILNVALPTLVRELHASASQLQWIVDAYALAFASLLLTAGSLGDRFGRKRMLTAGLTIFVVASAAAAFAGSPGVLIGTRAAMGAGAALIMPSTLSIVTHTFPEKERGRAIGIWAGLGGLGIILGPTVGGWLLDNFWWGSVFLINAPIVAVTLVGTWLLVPESRDPAATPLDPAGALLSAAGLVALVYGIIEVPGHGWAGGLTLGSFGGAAALLSLFVVWEFRSAHPLLNIRFFRNPRFWAACVAVTLVFFAMNGALFMLTQYLQFVRGYTPLQAGIRLLPILTVLAAAPLSALAVQKAGARAVVTVGLLLDALGLWMASTVSPAGGYGLLAAALAVVGVGQGLTMAPAMTSIMGSLPPGKFGAGSAMNSTAQMLGGALGVAVIGSLLSSAYSSSIGPAVSGLPRPAAAAARNSVGAAAEVAARLGPAGRTLLAAARSAFVTGMGTTMLVAIGCVAAGALIALLFLPSPPAPPAHTAAEPPAQPVHARPENVPG